MKYLVITTGDTLDSGRSCATSQARKGFSERSRLTIVASAKPLSCLREVRNSCRCFRLLTWMSAPTYIHVDGTPVTRSDMLERTARMRIAAIACSHDHAPDGRRKAACRWTFGHSRTRMKLGLEALRTRLGSRFDSRCRGFPYWITEGLTVVLEESRRLSASGFPDATSGPEYFPVRP
jgi:hypothetical protein